MSGYKEFDVTHPAGTRRVRVTREQAERTLQVRGTDISVWGTDVSRGPADDAMLVFLGKADWDNLPWQDEAP
jgi:hypothetical protein